MATISVEGDRLHIRMSGWQSFFALRRAIDVPLHCIVSVDAGSLTSKMPDGIRLPGTYVPKLITAGSYWWKEKGWSFWSVRRVEKAIDLRLRDHHFSRIVVEVDDPHATARMIDEAIRSYVNVVTAA